MTMPDQSPRSFQGWREDGIWHLPHHSLHATKSKIMHKNYAHSKMQLENSRKRGIRRQREDTTDLSQRPAKRQQVREVASLPLRASGTKQLMGHYQNFRLLSSYKRQLVGGVISSRTPGLMSPAPLCDSSSRAVSKVIETSLSRELEKMTLKESGFPLFLQLPAELRLRIYLFALPHERFVEMIIERPDDVGHAYSMRSPTPVPALLHVCYESRSEALKFYSLRFGGKYLFSKHKPRVYFNMRTDILFLNCHRSSNLSLMDFLCAFDDVIGDFAGMNEVTKISVCAGVAKNLARRHRYITRPRPMYIPRMCSLKRVICVSQDQTSLANPSIFPSSLDTSSIALGSREIDVLETIFGVKLEFGVVGTGDSKVRIILVL